jgi:hypothetical protein
MRIDIAKLKANGFMVQSKDDVIDIWPSGNYDVKVIEAEVRRRVTDPALANYALDAALTAIQRAQILSLCD